MIKVTVNNVVFRSPEIWLISHVLTFRAPIYFQHESKILVLGPSVSRVHLYDKFKANCTPERLYNRLQWDMVESWLK